MDPTEKRIKEILYRRFCPTEMELGEHELGLLDASRREEIVFHVQTCPRCQQDLVQVRDFMVLPLTREEVAKDLAVRAAPFSERVKIFVVNLLSPPLDTSTSPALQPVLRGKDDEMQTQVHQIGEYLVTFSFQKDPTQLEKYNLLGDVSPLDESDVDFLQWKAHLWQADRLLDAVPLDKDGNFIFASVQISDTPYELILSGPETEIHLQNLQRA